jgi:hypothetical protein
MVACWLAALCWHGRGGWPTAGQPIGWRDGAMGSHRDGSGPAASLLAMRVECNGAGSGRGYAAVEVMCATPA